MTTKILFINFAPISFLGGVERWMYNMHKEFGLHDIQSHFLNVASEISNIYARLVLKRNFDVRCEDVDIVNNSTLITFKSLIPFTSENRKVRDIIGAAEKIYFKLEILELGIILYFGGFQALRKSIAGVRSCYYYHYPLTLLDYIHNFVYLSAPVKYLLNKVHKIHVLTNRDKQFFKEKLKISNVIQIPNYIDFEKISEIGNKSDLLQPLHIVFVGELNLRKGIDVLIEIIESQRSYIFTIVGDGPLSSKIQELEELYPNIQYCGHLAHSQVSKIYSDGDVFILPSRAEGFANVILEALAYGLVVVDSDAVSVNLPNAYEKEVPNLPDKYIEVLQSLDSKKDEIRTTKTEKRNYCKQHYSKEVVMPRIMSEVFNVM